MALLIVSVAVFGLSFGGGKPSVSTFTDKRDGKVYRLVGINGHVWMAENLNFAAKGSKCYNNRAENCVKYGRLYDWYTADTVCPAGFHLPSDDEWTTLKDTVGGWETAGTKLKSTSGWNGNGSGTDNFKFSALPGGGSHDSGGKFSDAGNDGDWWSVTEYGASKAGLLNLNYRYGRFGLCLGYKWNLYSVRCVQDSKEGEQ